MPVFERPSVSCKAETPCSPWPNRSRICRQAACAKALQIRAWRSKISASILPLDLVCFMSDEPSRTIWLTGHQNVDDGDPIFLRQSLRARRGPLVLARRGDGSFENAHRIGGD